jgi:hypothetical protein
MKISVNLFKGGNKMNPFDQLIDEPKTETTESKNIRDILYRRSDLSTFVVHLTRNKENLEGIVKSWTIEARSVWGLAKNKFADHTPEAESQKCVCFTEAPLEYLNLIFGKIDGRDFQPGPFGIAITKKVARKKGLNPIWYVDMTPGQDKQWELSKALDRVRDERIDKNKFKDSYIEKITPFIEQMYPGTGNGHPKEFWWEREWRNVGNFNLPGHVLLLCPESDFDEFETLAKTHDPTVKCIDPNWGLEKIIARLAGFKNDEIDIL